MSAGQARPTSGAPLQVEAVLEIVMGSACRLFEGAGGSVMLLVGDDELEVVTSPTNPKALGARVRLGDGVAGTVAACCDPALVSGRTGDRWSPVDSGMCVPLLHDGSILGVLNVNGGPTRTFVESDLEACALFAGHASDALAGARLYESARRDGADRPERHLEAMLRALHAAASVDFVTPGPDEPVDLSAIATSIARVEHGNGRPTVVNGDLDDVIVKGRSRELRRLLQELVDNGHRHGRAPVRLIIEPADDTVRLIVADHGSRLPVADHRRMFEPYGRLERDGDGEGIGLGLSIARRIAMALGGTLEVADSVTDGTAFALALRRSEQSD